MEPKVNACMTTGMPLPAGDYPPNTIVVYRNGEVIGLLSPEAQEDVRTLRMTFTRSNRSAQFEPLQGQCIEAFGPEHRHYADHD